MTDTDIVTRLAREASAKAEMFLDYDSHHLWEPSTEWLVTFSALLAEECAKVCDQEAASSKATYEATGSTPSAYVARGKEECAEAIRAKFKA